MIDKLAGKLDATGKLNDREKFKEAIWAREKQVSTGLENGLALPHAKTPAVKEPALAFGLSTGGIDYQAIDGKLSRIFL